MSKPKISIITVNYHQREVTGELLRSIQSCTYPNMEVILVDNEQLGDDTPFYQEILPKVQVINSETNLGFAGANNLGMQKATGDFFFFLNNDTVLGEGVIETLLSGFSIPDTGAVCPVIRYAENPEKIQFAGFTPIHPLTGRNSLDQMLSDQPWKESYYFHGAAVLIPREVVEQIGEMPEEYFLYYEELDWSQRLRDLGLKIQVGQEVSIMHKESISTGKNSPLKVYYQTRNRILFMRRNANSFFVFLLFFLLISLPKNWLKLRQAHAKAFRRGVLDALVFQKSGWTDPVEFSIPR
ncbi:glycosyltransferase family 2 protein [Algoriphagus formosus]|uniref:Glycosyltransferase family 2 protein n=1 Tax=Algoriphagus formosus TaxID=2007308 RepID=A0A4R5UY06_9BACT|nr:glycosyltransferase family 2 protein [Algoriphagus aquimaris]TDK44212.1 glycosyltransferase family 2 protein [Algoriphagus aquimaris]